MNSSLVFIVLSLATVALAIRQRPSRDDMERLIEIREECVHDAGVTKQVYKNGFVVAAPEDPAYPSYLYCVAEKRGFIDGEGRFDREEYSREMTRYGANRDRIEDEVDRCFAGKNTHVAFRPCAINLVAEE